MAKLDNQGNWINRNGRSIPPGNVDPVQKERDKVVTAIVEKGLKLEKLLKDTKAEVLNMVYEYIGYVQAANDVKKEDTKGNYTLSDFSNLKQVEVSINNIIEFDERINIAKNLVDKCLIKWTKKANQNIRAIVTDAFDVDQKGKLNKVRVLSLLGLKIADKDWKKAMALISESMQTTATKPYFNIRTRENYTEKWNTINLNFSSL